MALDLAGQLLAELTALPAVQRAAYAGSLRRMRETIGDIDLLAASSRPAEVMRAFCSSPRVTRVLAHGPTKASVLSSNGVQVDLRVVEPSVWGAALMYFTGSKPHNIRVRAIAVRAGLKLSEYGLFYAERARSLPPLPRKTSIPALACPGSRRPCAKTAVRSRRLWPTCCPIWCRRATSVATCTCIPT